MQSTSNIEIKISNRNNWTTQLIRNTVVSKKKYINVPKHWLPCKKHIKEFLLESKKCQVFISKTKIKFYFTFNNL